MAKTQIATTFIKNNEGKFFVHQRAASKRIMPSRYGIGAGGHVDEGEEVADAAKRELLEETGLTCPVEYLFTMDFETPDINHITHFFLAIHDGPITPDEREWQWWGWMTKEEVDTLCAAGKLCDDTAVLYQRGVADGKL